MNALAEFEEKFGRACLEETIDRAGFHAGVGFGHDNRKIIPTDKQGRLFFSLLEILDWQCVKYKDAPAGLTEESIESFLKRHAEDVLKLPEPPSYIGVLAGRFNFLREAVKHEE